MSDLSIAISNVYSSSVFKLMSEDAQNNLFNSIERVKVGGGGYKNLVSNLNDRDKLEIAYTDMMTACRIGHSDYNYDDFSTIRSRLSELNDDKANCKTIVQMYAKKEMPGASISPGGYARSAGIKPVSHMQQFEQQKSSTYTETGYLR